MKLREEFVVKALEVGQLSGCARFGVSVDCVQGLQRLRNGASTAGCIASAA